MTDTQKTQRLSGVRGLIARRMRESLAQAAQLSFHATVDASAALTLVQQEKSAGVSVTLEDIVAWVYLRCIDEYPAFNGTCEAGQFLPGDGIHLGVAIGVTEHLTVAVIADAHAMDLHELATARRSLVRAAAKNALKPAQMRGATTTVSNLGKGRTEAFTPILNPPQVALMGVSALLQRPWVTPEGEMAIRPTLGLSLTVDHQWIDGAPANQFLSRCCELLETLG